MDLLSQIQTLIEAGAWIQIYANGKPQAKIALGAATWIHGRGLLFAELGAEHQGHVHLIEAQSLEMDGAVMVDAYDLGGRLVATVSEMSRDEVAEYNPAACLARISADTPTGAAWRRFWAQQIEENSKTEQ